MYRWLPNHIPPKVRLWAKLCVLSTTIHLVFLACFFFIPDAHVADFSTSLRTQINQEVTVVYIPGHQTVVPAHVDSHSTSLASAIPKNDSENESRKSLKPQTAMKSAPKEPTKKEPMKSVQKQVENNQKEKKLAPKVEPVKKTTPQIAKKVTPKSAVKPIQGESKNNPVQKSATASSAIIVGNKEELAAVERAVAIKNELEHYWMPPLDSRMGGYMCTVTFEIDKNGKPMNIKTIALSGNLLYESAVKRAVIRMECKRSKPGEKIKITAKGQELEIWLA